MENTKKFATIFFVTKKVYFSWKKKKKIRLESKIDIFGMKLAHHVWWLPRRGSLDKIIQPIKQYTKQILLLTSNSIDYTNKTNI